TLYVEHLARRLRGETLQRVDLLSPFVLRSVDPPIRALESRRVCGVQRLGKQIVIEFDGDIFLVVHLMIAGRFHWKKPAAKLGRKMGLAAFHFAPGTLQLTEAATKKRASLHVVRGAAALEAFDRGGLDVLTSTLEEFDSRLRLENHTLKRSLIDPRLFSGIGNAYSDEILHRARLSPLRLTQKLSRDEVERLRSATGVTLVEWTDRLRQQTGDAFPERVTAFHPEMAVHGRYRSPCPV